MKTEKWYQSPWIISLGTAIFSFVLTIINDLIKQKKLFSTINDLVTEGIDTILLIFNFEIKLWIVLLSLITIFIISKIFRFLNSPINHTPKFLNYKEDILRDWKWSWSWVLDKYTLNWNIQNLKAHCPKCDTRMLAIEHFAGTDFNCPRCDFNFNDLNNSKSLIKIGSLISDNLNRKENY